MSLEPLLTDEEGLALLISAEYCYKERYDRMPNWRTEMELEGVRRDLRNHKKRMAGK